MDNTLRKMKAFDKRIFGYLIKNLYSYILKPILFQIDPEKVHVGLVRFGEVISKTFIYKVVLGFSFRPNIDILKQEILGIKFNTPIGLAAGFDYEARLTQALEPLGFGFQTVGTITNNAYIGNPKPMLGRLPKSKSLMVNKGFKNPGALTIGKKLSVLSFPIPLGISIGKTNTLSIKTQKQAVQDIINTFKVFESAKIGNSFYELNISCPNLLGNISFYPQKNLKELLNAVDNLNLKKPVFVKMPIEKSENETIGILDIISKSKVSGVIIGNLQKNRKNKKLNPQEVQKFKVGYFSGKPTEDDANRLIELTYKKYGNRFLIIGCGGVFTGKDAYEKIIRGATLIQFITGIIYNGPQQASLISFELSDILKKNGFSNISEAIGSKFKKRK